MEINHYGDTILGGVATEDMMEGLFVCLTSHSWDTDFGSQTDLPGFKLPTTAAEAARSRYIVTFAQDNRSTPLILPMPQMSWAMREGWSRAANAPFSATVYLTHPGNQESQTIPSGSNCVAFGEGIYTVPSGAYVYSASLLTPGCLLDVADTASDSAGVRGKLHAGTTAPVAEVVRFDTTTGRLTFKVLH